MDAHPITSFSDLVEPWRDAFLTARGSLVRAIELGGVDTDSLTETDLVRAVGPDRRHPWHASPLDLGASSLCALQSAPASPQAS